MPTNPHLVAEIRGFQMSSYAVLQVRTRSGLVGYGECNELSGSDLKATNQALAGRAASSYQVLDGMVPTTMRGGLNIALLDILGKATQAPIYRMLGGPTRNKARAITRLAGESDAELQNDLQRQLAAGYRPFLVPIVPPAARNQGSVFAHALPQTTDARSLPIHLHALSSTHLLWHFESYSLAPGCDTFLILHGIAETFGLDAELA
jgi:L-alanine-DL-glutamate epimerase-like enolase superfamily enzyme